MLRAEEAVMPPQREAAQVPVQPQEIAGGELAQALVVAVPVVVRDKPRDLAPLTVGVAVGVETVLQVEGGAGVERVAEPDARLREVPGGVALLEHECAHGGVRPPIGPDDRPVTAPAHRDVRVGEQRFAKGVRQRQSRAGARVVVEHKHGEVGVPLGHRERAGQQRTLARCPVSGQREPIAEQRFEAEHVLPFDLAPPPLRIQGLVEIEGIDGDVEGVHPERSSMNDVPPSAVEEVHGSRRVLGVQLVHVKSYRSLAFERAGACERTARGRHGHRSVPGLQPGRRGGGEVPGVVPDILGLGHEPRCVGLAAACPNVEQPL